MRSKNVLKFCKNKRMTRYCRYVFFLMITANFQLDFPFGVIVRFEAFLVSKFLVSKREIGRGKRAERHYQKGKDKRKRIRFSFRTVIVHYFKVFLIQNFVSFKTRNRKRKKGRKTLSERKGGIYSIKGLRTSLLITNITDFSAS